MRDARAVRFEGQVLRLRYDNSEWVSWANVKRLDGPSPLALAGIEAKGYVGMVKLSMEEDATGGVIISAQGLLDYQSAERLLLEVGELGVSVEVRLGEQNALSVPLSSDGTAWPRALTICRADLVRVAPGSPNALKLAPMSWLFF